MSHMRLQVIQGDWIEINGRDGTEWIEADLAPLRPGHSLPTHGQLAQYVQGSLRGAVITMRRGWYGARYSAPGYMDRTDWIVCRTEAQARDAAIDCYGIEEEEGES